MIEAYLSNLRLAYFEATVAFEGLADANVWKRPVEALLSVGELAGHVAYWGAGRLAGEGQVSSPLIDPRFRYYPETLATSPSEQHRAMTAQQVCDELVRVHEEAVAHLMVLSPDLESVPPGGEPFPTYDEMLKYQVFHVSYHVGQMYTVRHLLGEETPDN